MLCLELITEVVKRDYGKRKEQIIEMPRIGLIYVAFMGKYKRWTRPRLIPLFAFIGKRQDTIANQKARTQRKTEIGRASCRERVCLAV